MHGDNFRTYDNIYLCMTYRRLFLMYKVASISDFDVGKSRQTKQFHWQIKIYNDKQTYHVHKYCI